MAKYKLVGSMGYASCDHENEIDTEDSFSDEEWEEMSEDEKDKYLMNRAEESVMEQIDYWYEKCDDELGNCF